MAKPTEQSGESFMLKLARFIVDKRNLVFLVVIIGLIFSVFSRSWVQVENDLTAYLPADSETRQALDVMDEQFTTFGTASVMVANLPLADAFDLQEKLEDVEGVQGVAFDETDEHYNNVSALFSVTFAYSEDDEACLDSLDAVKELLADYDLYIDTDLGNTQQETIDHEISVIMVYVAIVIVLAVVLLRGDQLVELVETIKKGAVIPLVAALCTQRGKYFAQSFAYSFAFEAVGERMGKTLILADDKPGFIVNRALLPMLNEACVVVGSFIGSVEDMDNGMKLGCNHPMGPLELADMIGLDILLNVMNVLS